MTRGAALLDLLLALVLMSFGVLAVAAGAAAVSRRARIALGDAEMARLGAQEMERLAASAPVAETRDARAEGAGPGAGAGAYEVRSWADGAGEGRSWTVVVTFRWGGLRRGDTLAAVWPP